MNEENITSTDNQVNRKDTFPEPKKSSRNAWLIGCSVVLLLLACICSVFAVFSSSIFNSVPGSFSPQSDLPIEETVVNELGNTSSFTNSKIAVIEIVDVVEFATQSSSSIGTNNKTIIAQINKAKSDDSVKAVVLRFNTPGGAVDAAEPICRAIKDLNDEKPVYSFIDSQGASLGYLLPNCSEFIYARPSAITGSIGVRADLLDLTGILTNIGARTTTITNSEGDQKAQDGLFDKNSEEYKNYQMILDEVYEYFIKTVWDGRKDKTNGLTEAQLRSYADGRIFSGLQAKEAGLVDEIGEYEDVLNSVYEKTEVEFGDNKVQVIEYTVYEDPWATLFGNLNLLGTMMTSEKHSREKLQLMMIK